MPVALRRLQAAGQSVGLWAGGVGRWVQITGEPPHREALHCLALWLILVLFVYCAQVSEWDAEFVEADPVLVALAGLFQQFWQQEEQVSSGNSMAAPVDPAALRQALSDLPGQGYMMGERAAREV